MEKRKLHKRFFAVLAVMLLILPLFLTGAAGVTAFAAETGYTGALEDLQKDENFNVEEYPDNARDYSIKVIQIAESTAGELFIYTYQPSQKTQNLVATEINMSLTENVDGTRLYSLTLLSCDGVLCKYKVDNFVMVEDIIRYYNITSIYRKWIKDIDEETGNDNTINAVAFEVGKLWGVLVENGEVHYGCIEIETIEITDKFVGYLRNWTGVIFGGHKSQDNHYVAFSTNKPMDKLIDADVYYTSQSVDLSGIGNELNHSVVKKEYGEKESKIVTLSNVDTVTVVGTLFTKTYTWNRVQSAEKFSASNNLKDPDKEAIANKEWVLLFAETNYEYTSSPSQLIRKKYTEVSDVSILRLKFETNGKVYNLGVVDGKQTSGERPSNKPDTVLSRLFNTFEKIWNALKCFFTGKSTWWVYLIVVIAVLILLPTILGFFIPAVGKFLKSIGKALLWLVKGVWWLMRRVAVLIWLMISAPFRMIARAVKRRREEKYNAPDPKPDKTGRIYKTTDGYLSGRSDIKKPRNIAAIEQRKDDGALAVVKVYSRKGKEQKLKEGKNYIPKLVLKPKKHAALKKDSIVGRQVIVGVKQGNGKPPKSIFPGDLEKTQDKLTKKELKKIQAEVQNDNPKNRAHHEAKMKKWRKHFQDK